jgi:protein-disulfide isomerase
LIKEFLMFRWRFLALAALVVLGVLLIVVVGKRQQAPQTGPVVSTHDQSKVPPPQPSGEHVLGRPDAPVAIIEYASLTCPHCAAFHEKELPKLMKAYIDTGKAKLIFRGLTLNPLDTSAQMATHCVAEDKYFPFVSALYVTQKSWATANDPMAALLQVSKQAGFTKDSFEKCLRNQAALDEINAVRKAFEEKLGPARTPTFIVDGQVLKEEASFEALEKLILSHSKS